MSDSAIRRSSKRSRKRLRTKANLLARDAQVFLTSCDFDIPVARDAEKLVSSALELLRIAVQVDLFEELQEEADDDS